MQLFTKPFLDTAHVTYYNAMVQSRLDCANSLLFGCSISNTVKLPTLTKHCCLHTPHLYLPSSCFSTCNCCLFISVSIKIATLTNKISSLTNQPQYLSHSLAWLSVWSEMQTCHSLSLASVKSQIGFTFLVPAHLGSPGKRAVKRVCVCLCVCMCVCVCVCGVCVRGIALLSPHGEGVIKGTLNNASSTSPC